MLYAVCFANEETKSNFGLLLERFQRDALYVSFDSACHSLDTGSYTPGRLDAARLSAPFLRR